MIKQLTRGILPGLAGLLALGLSSAVSASIIYSADSSGILTIDVLPAAVLASNTGDVDSDTNPVFPPGTASASAFANSGFSPGANPNALIAGDNVFADAATTGSADDGGSVDSFAEASSVLVLENSTAVDQTITLTLDYFVFAAAMVDSIASEEAIASATLFVESLILNTVLFEFFAEVDTFLDGADAMDGSGIPTSLSFNIIVPAGSTEQLTVFSAADGEGFSAVLTAVPLPGSLLLLVFGGLLIQRRQQPLSC